ncbi:MAG: hypothetical protein Q9M30_04000 [Mariprofundaceae bacterium]|nr:hypothetical protein [Mariprofundaceae bacterium]
MQRIFTQHNLVLAALFLLALPVFCWLQWQPKAWFQAQLEANGLSEKISYASVEKSFPGLHLNQANIALPEGKSLALDEVRFHPSISSLLHGEPALYLHATNQGIEAESIIAQNDGRLSLHDLMLTADAGSLAHFDSRLILLGLKGGLSLKGELVLQAADGLPVDGDLKLEWAHPSSTMLPAGADHIQLSLATTDAEGDKVWSWKIISQPEGLGGEGKLMAGSPDIRQWLLRGTMRMVKSQPDSILSGTLGAPHWQ